MDFEQPDPFDVPQDIGAYGIVRDPEPELEATVQATIDMHAEATVTEHVCRADSGQPLCSADADPEAPVYRFYSGQKRRSVVAAFDRACSDCVQELQREVRDGR